MMKKTMQSAPSWLQRMLLALQKYDIELKYIARKENILTDTLSHASLKEMIEDIEKEELETQVHMVYKNAQAISAKMKEIQETAKDSCVMRITRYNTKGWFTRRYQIPADVKSY